MGLLTGQQQEAEADGPADEQFDAVQEQPRGEQRGAAQAGAQQEDQVAEQGQGQRQVLRRPRGGLPANCREESHMLDKLG